MLIVSFRTGKNNSHLIQKIVSETIMTDWTEAPNSLRSFGNKPVCEKPKTCQFNLGETITTQISLHPCKWNSSRC